MDIRPYKLPNHGLKQQDLAKPVGQEDWLDNVQTWAEAHKGARLGSIVQHSRDGEGFTLATRNGRGFSFLAGLTKIFFRVFKVDVYDTFQIGNNERQRSAFVKFQTEMKEKKNTDVVPGQKLTLQLINIYKHLKTNIDELPVGMQGNK